MERLPRDPPYKKVPPKSIYEFRYTTPTEILFFPELPKNRICTHLFFLIIFAVVLIILIGFSVWITARKDIRRLLNGYDFCGNICGVNNTEITKNHINCTPEDYTDYPLLLYLPDDTKQCIKVDECESPNQEVIFGRCFPTEVSNTSTSKFLQNEKLSYEVMYNITRSKPAFFAMLLIAIVPSVALFFCFRLRAYATFMTLLLAAMVLSIGVTVTCWYLYLVEHKYTYLLPGILVLVYLVAVLILLLFLSNRFSLVVGLYAEAAKYIIYTPILLVQPALTTLFLFILTAIFVYVIMLTYSTTEDARNSYSAIRWCYIIFLVLMMDWLFAIANGCQCMIVAGVITAYYFQREKSTLKKTLCKSAWITVRYHLGTAVVGSIIISLLRIVKFPVRRIRIHHRDSRLAVYLTRLKECTEYLSKKSYIMTALHGRGFYQSGERGARVLWFFLCDMIDIDVLSYVSMHVISFLIILASVTVGVAIQWSMNINYEFIPSIIGAYLVGIVTFFYISLMNVVTIETLLLCVCEDRLMNSGSRYSPYFMSPELFAIIIEALEQAYRESSVVTTQTEL
ncbi:unnamed protein product [Tenebrio molitor]|nr:unnamed protein product [Tenebrio molitor]